MLGLIKSCWFLVVQPWFLHQYVIKKTVLQKLFHLIALWKLWISTKMNCQRIMPISIFACDITLVHLCKFTGMCMLTSKEGQIPWQQKVIEKQNLQCGYILARQIHLLVASIVQISEFLIFFVTSEVKGCKTVWNGSIHYTVTTESHLEVKFAGVWGGGGYILRWQTHYWWSFWAFRKLCSYLLQTVTTFNFSFAPDVAHAISNIY